MGKRSKVGSTRQLFVSIILFLLFWCRLWGLDPDKTVDSYLEDQWEMVDGIPSNIVKSITQTPDGYLWVGTNKGLVRFDGMKFVPVPFGEKEGGDSQEIRHLFVDREETLWIGSAVGLTLYRRPENRFKIFTRTDGITEDGIRHIIDDMRGNTWISFTTGYVNRFSNGEFFVYNASHGLLGKKINAIVEDRQGNLLFGTHGNGIFTYKADKFSKYLVPGLGSALIVTMYEDRSGNLWIGTKSGLFRVTDVNRATGKGIKRYTTEDGLASDHISSILEDSERNLWVGTTQGLNRIKKKQDGAIGFESLSKPRDEIMCLFEDSEKSLWIGTDNSGIFRLKDRKFMPYAPFETHSEEIPASLFEDRHGDTWIGTASGKLFRCRGGELIEPAAFPELSGAGITAIAEDAEGNLWLGTTGNGVFKKKKNRLARFTPREELADDVVTSIYRDSRNNLWFSTFDGVSVLRSRDGIIESFNSRDGLSGKRVHNIYESKTGDILIAADRGITILENVFVGSRGSFFKKSPWSPKVILRGISVTCIYEDPSAPDEEGSIYWVATKGKGLKRLGLKDGTITSIISYTTTNGMTTNSIYQFLEDPGSNFWLMSDSGILRVGKNDLNRFAYGGNNEINCTSFGTADGMESFEFDNKFSRNSALKAGNGEFRFITKKGISVVNPGKIRINKIPPPVVIEEVFFNRRSIPLHQGAGPVALKDITSLSFHFTAPTFLSPGKIKFKYRLEGYEEEWISLSPGQERVAQYRDLSPGTYTFRVTARNDEGVGNRTGDSMTFTLEPFFYQTFLFKIAVLLLFTALVAAAFYIYKKRKRSFEKRAKYKGTPLNPYFAEECITRLKYLMDIEKVYCDVDLSLQSLAEKLSISPHQLSQLLNEKMDRNFADFINWYRVEEAKKILQSPGGARRKIPAVAGEAGFSTMSSFYKVFKKYTGTTPIRYKENGGNKK